LPSDVGVAVVRSVNLLKIAAAAEVLRYRCVAVRQGSSAPRGLHCVSPRSPGQRQAAPARFRPRATRRLRPARAQPARTAKAMAPKCGTASERSAVTAPVSQKSVRGRGQGQQGKVPRVRHRATAAEPARLALGTLGVDLTASKPNGTAMMRLMPSRMSVVSFYR
jgi:hypothetical protein